MAKPSVPLSPRGPRGPYYDPGAGWQRMEVPNFQDAAALPQATGGDRSWALHWFMVLCTGLWVPAGFRVPCTGSGSRTESWIPHGVLGPLHGVRGPARGSGSRMGYYAWQEKVADIPTCSRPGAGNADPIV